MDFRRTRLIERRTTATEVIAVDLPVAPLSHLIITIDGYNVTDETTLAEFLAFLNNVAVTDSGVTVVDVQSEDLYALQAYLLRRLPELTGRLATDNYNRALTLIVPFGRKLFNPAECYPARKKGEVTLRVDTTVPATSIDNSTISIDCVELPGASPEHFLKSYRRAIAAPGATGETSLDLQIGNELVCLQLRMVTIPGASSHTYGIDVVKLRADNQERLYCSADMQCLTGERALRVGCPETSIAAQGLANLGLIAWIDFDPNTDGQFLLDTAGLNSLKLALTYGVNEAANLTTLERVKAIQ
jgi:hypothetical protein